MMSPAFCVTARGVTLVTPLGLSLTQSLGMKADRSAHNVPDLAHYVTHFTGRSGKRINVDPAVEALPDEQRLLQILIDQKIRGQTLAPKGRAGGRLRSVRDILSGLSGEPQVTGRSSRWSRRRGVSVRSCRGRPCRPLRSW